MTRYQTRDKKSRRHTATRVRLEHALLRDLIAVLDASPGGLRRWSVMQRMRVRAAKAGRDVPLKFEDEVERVFRAYCSTEPLSESESRMFFKPSEKAGEVWAVDRMRASSWLSER